MSDEPEQSKGAEEDDTLSLIAAIGRGEEAVQRLDERTATVERLLGQIETLAGGLEADAILGLSEWALRNERWPELLRLVKTAESALALAGRLHHWYTLLERGLRAARTVSDRATEAWLEGQLGAAAASLDRPEEARLHLRRANRIRRELAGKRPRLPRRLAELVDRGAVLRRGAPRPLLGVAGLVLAAGAGLAVGFSMSEQPAATTTSSVMTLTTTLGGKTTTLPGATVTNVKATTLTVTLPLPTPPPNIDGLWSDGSGRIVVYHGDDGGLVALLLTQRHSNCPPSAGDTVGRSLKPSGNAYAGEWNWADAVDCGSNEFTPATLELVDKTTASVVVEPPATATDPAATVTLSRISP